VTRTYDGPAAPAAVLHPAPRSADTRPGLGVVLGDLFGPRGVGLLVIAVLSVLSALAVDAAVSSDTAFQLIWGSHVAAGEAPDLRAYGATPHPLAIAAWGAASLLGREPAFDIVLASAHVSLAALAWASFRLGQVTLSVPAGIVSASAVLVFPAYVGAALRTYVDAPFLALVLLAAVLEACRPRRGAAVLVLLALAGLLRPEAWLLAGLYWLWMVPVMRRSARAAFTLTALTAAAPLLWALSDLIGAGDPLWSLTSTQEGAVALGRVTGAENVPRTLTQHLLGTIGPVALAGGAVGGLIALVQRDRRVLVVLALGAAGVASYAAIGAAGLSQIPRYVLLPGLALAMLFGYATTRVPAELARGRRGAAVVAGALVLVGALVLAPARPGGQRSQFRALEGRADAVAGLRSLADDPGAAGLLRRCAPVAAVSSRPVPFLAYFLDRSPHTFGSLERGRSEPGPRRALDRGDRGVVLMPRDRATLEWFVRDSSDAKRVDPRPPAGMREAVDTSTWRLLRGSCA
jgi:hypothetical protein